MKRKFRSRFTLPPGWLGAAAVFLAAAMLLRMNAAAQTRPAPAGTGPQTQSAPQAQSVAQTQPAAQAEPVNPEPAKTQTYWELYLKGGPFMYPLTLCSVLAVALIVERFLALRREKVIPRTFLTELRMRAPDLLANRAEALAFCRNTDSPIARMLAAGIKRLPRGIVAAEKAIEDAGANEALKLRRNMRFLYAMGSVATLLGLIGTISGMIKAFQNAAASGTGNVNVQNLSAGIYEAMVNTFAGLAIAIIVTSFYYFFVGRIERLISELNDCLVRFSDEFDFDKAEFELD